MATDNAFEIAHDTKLGTLLAKLSAARSEVAQYEGFIATTVLPVVNYTGQEAQLPNLDRMTFVPFAELPEGTIYYQEKTFNRGDEGIWVKGAQYGSGHFARTAAKFEDVLSIAAGIAAHGEAKTADHAAKLLNRYNNLKASAAQTAADIAAHEENYTGWVRYFLVVSSAGHVHNGLNCSTCYPTTAYSPVVSLSGKGADEAIDLLGSTLCSVCFPEAPISGKPKKITKAQAKKLAAA